jgi:hypothetical protein
MLYNVGKARTIVQDVSESLCLSDGLATPPLLGGMWSDIDNDSVVKNAPADRLEGP